MFGSQKRLYTDGAHAEGIVVRVGASTTPNYYWYTVRVDLPNGSTVEIDSGSDGLGIAVGDPVPVRYDPSRPKKVVLDVPALQARVTRAEAQRGGAVDLRADLLAAVAGNDGGVIDYRSADRSRAQT